MEFLGMCAQALLFIFYGVIITYAIRQYFITGWRRKAEAAHSVRNWTRAEAYDGIIFVSYVGIFGVWVLVVVRICNI